MTINPLYDISRVYLEQIAESSHLETDMKKRAEENEEARKEMMKTKAHKDMAKAARKAMGIDEATDDPIDVPHKMQRLPNNKVPKPDPQQTSAIAAALKLRARAKASKKVDEAAKPDYLDFDDDGNEKESMKKALKDKAKQKVEEAKKPNDGNLANNYPPYDKVTRGDVIAGATGKDQMGGKKKKVKEGYSNWREDLKEVLDSDSQDQNLKKVEEKKGIKNKVTINPEMREAIEQLGGQLIEMVELDEKTLTAAETKKKEEIVKSMKDKAADFERRYPGRGKEVMYATATKMAKKMVEQEMKLQPKTEKQEPTSFDKKISQQNDRQRQQEIQILNKKLQSLKSASKGSDPSIMASYNPEGELIDERRRSEKGTPRAPRNPAFELISKSMGVGRMGVQPRGVKKEKGAPTPGPIRTPAQKVQKIRDAAKKAQDMMHSRYD